MAADRRVEDDCGRSLELVAAPQRIVCLCPSISETVHALAAEKLIGRTRYCIHPAAAMAAVETVGGTKNPDLDAILRLRPDLVIAEKEENRPDDIAQLAPHVPVYVFDVHSLSSAFAMIERLGALLGADSQARAAALAQGLRRSWSQLTPAQPGHSALYLIWRKPWMAAASGTYIDSVLQALGLSNVLSTHTRYPELSEAEIVRLQPRHVLLSSEPFPFAEKHRDELRRLLPDAQVHCVDGELFSWYGVRMQEAITRFPEWMRGVGLSAC